MDEVRKMILDLLKEALSQPRTPAEAAEYERRLDLALKVQGGLS